MKGLPSKIIKKPKAAKDMMDSENSSPVIQQGGQPTTNQFLAVKKKMLAQLHPYILPRMYLICNYMCESVSNGYIPSMLFVKLVGHT